MIRQLLQKRRKIVSGILNTHVRKRVNNYDDSKWWDTSFYTKGVSDRQTISSKKSPFTAKYHYASVEMQILRHLRNHELSIAQSRVLDIGSGAGHWIDFYLSFDPQSVTGMDVSSESFKHLSQKYDAVDNVDIHQGKALDVMQDLTGNFDLVNAIGVMFHIVDDAEWENTIKRVGDLLRDDGGMFVVGGHFGWMDGLNVQIGANEQVNKRLRSKSHWKKTLKSAGFNKIRIYKNNAYLWINEALPENNVLVATK